MDKELPLELVKLDSASSSMNDLAEIRQDKKEQALRHLITGKTPRDVVFQKPVGGGVSTDYIPGWWFVDQLNALFGYFWDFEIVDKYIGNEQIWVLGKITIKDPGTGLTVTKTAFGGSKIKSKGNPSIDIGDDLKSAATDSLKKAATLLGLAADIYGNREVKSETAPTRVQQNNLYKIGEKKGLNKSAVDKICEEKFGKVPEELESAKVLTFMAELRKLEDKMSNP